jgi:hypothetical protein
MSTTSATLMSAARITAGSMVALPSRGSSWSSGHLTIAHCCTSVPTAAASIVPM